MFFWFDKKFVANEVVLPICFMLTETFGIFSCCVVTYENITSDTSTITRYENVQEIAMGYVKELGLNSEILFFIIKFQIYDYRHNSFNVLC